MSTNTDELREGEREQREREREREREGGREGGGREGGGGRERERELRGLRVEMSAAIHFCALINSSC